MGASDDFVKAENPSVKGILEHMRSIMGKGHHLYQMNDDLVYDCEPLVGENPFIDKEKEMTPLPTYDGSRDLLPQVVWDGHDDTLACYDKAWQIAFRNLRAPQPDDGMASNYIDTAFNGFLFMWDSSFITMFTPRLRSSWVMRQTAPGSAL